MIDFALVPIDGVFAYEHHDTQKLQFAVKTGEASYIWLTGETKYATAMNFDPHKMPQVYFCGPLELMLFADI